MTLILVTIPLYHLYEVSLRVEKCVDFSLIMLARIDT